MTKRGKNIPPEKYEALKHDIEAYKKVNPDANDSEVIEALGIKRYTFSRAMRGPNPWGNKARKKTSVKKVVAKAQPRSKRFQEAYQKLGIIPGIPAMEYGSLGNVTVFVVKGNPSQVAHVLSEIR